jgi:putative salt-induced outer membrane protein YdiY
MKKYIVVIVAVFLFYGLAKAEYSGEISGSYGSTAGNSNSQTTGGALDITRVTSSHEVNFQAEALYGESDGDKDTEIYEVSIYDRHFITDNQGLYWFNGMSWEENEFSGVKMRIGVNPGVGFRFIKGWLTVNAEAGPNGTYEESIDGTEEGFAIMQAYGDLSLDFKYLRLGADGKYQYPIEDNEDYRADGDGYVEVPFGDSGFSIRGNVNWTYLNYIPEGVEKHWDTYTTTSVVWRF